MPTHLANFIRRFRRYDLITGMMQIARRYFVMNAFDGALTTFGLIMGSYLAGVQRPDIVFAVGISTAVAIGISGLSGAFLTEKAERQRELKELEKQMLRKLSNSYQSEATTMAAYFTALVNGLSPSLTGFMILIPFLLAEYSIFGITMQTAYMISLSMALVIFFLLGAFLGKISKESVLGYGLKMLFAGVVLALVLYLLSAAGVVSTSTA